MKVASRENILRIIILVLVLILLLFIPPSIDYEHYTSAAKAWIEGRSQLYDSAAQEFFYAPWAMVLLVPLSLLPSVSGQLIFNLLSLMGLIAGVLCLAKPVSRTALILVLANLFTLNMLVSAQWDGITLAGAALAWWSLTRHRPYYLGIAFLMISAKPPNGYFALLLLVIAIKDWPLSQKLKTFAPPVLAVLASLMLFGVDWPFRYIQFLAQYPPPMEYNASLYWQVNIIDMRTGIHILLALVALAFTLWILVKNGITGATLALAMAVNLTLSGYVLSYHFIIASPALAWLTTRNWRWGAATYLLMLANLYLIAVEANFLLIWEYLFVIIFGSVWILLSEYQHKKAALPLLRT